MTRTHPSAQMQALQKIQLASMREKLKLDSARARIAMADAPKTGRVNQFGRSIVSYEDMPELDEGDLTLMEQEFHRLAVPHVAVLKYRPGFEDRGYSEDHARDCWWFYDTGVDILKALAVAVIKGKVPDVLDQISTDNLDVRDALTGLTQFLLLEREVMIQTAMECGLTPEAFKAKDAAELIEIRASVEARFKSMSDRRKT